MTNRRHRRPRSTASREPLPEVPFAVSTADDIGWTRGAQRHALEVGDIERVRRGVLTLPMSDGICLPPWEARELAHLCAARAAAVSSPRAVLSHLSAAVVHGLPTIGGLARPCLTVPSGTALRRVVAAHLHRATLQPDDVVVAGTDTVTAVERTVLDIAREHGVDVGVVAADHALHAGLVDERSLARAYEQCAGWPGRRAARITMLSADAAAESPLESLSRLRIAAQKIGTPRRQTRICDADGVFVGRCDFYWDEFGVIGEADGDLKYADGATSITAERRREQLFEELGLIVVRWGWSDLRTFTTVAARLQTGFARGARPGSSDRRWGVLPDLPLHPQR